MSIDVHDSAAATRTAAKRARKTAKKTAKRARTRANEAVDAARGFEIHLPEPAKKVAKRAAKRAAKQATAAAGRATHRTAKRAGGRAVRFTFGVLAVGGLVALGVVAARRMRAVPSVPVYEPAERGTEVTAPGAAESAVDGEGHTARVAP